ncbi:2,4-dichlorophenol 6-monooxygenase domain protein [Mycobacterium xenopi 4042]|uniref:2,4-dichlorophenol 6-monooxygenase domain protein n=1 Tax=Mycobacterium xenopi 4042 TaxID=1299334 RepID=X8DE26_MYCXE|nr:2,4-dichlorophenol 6-monooxygenase domain protein [Mycobacterium xenopi 4042]
MDDNRPQLPPDEEAPMFALLIGYQYRSAAVVSDEPAPANGDDVSLVEELRGQPGTRVPHAWVYRDGKRVSTLDLVGSGFTLFIGDDGAAWSDAAVSASRGVPISVQRIGTGVDVDGTWAAVTGLTRAGALLVRPMISSPGAQTGFHLTRKRSFTKRLRLSSPGGKHFSTREGC